ncbi:MAG TPA: hypothetical protein VGB24_23275 [Longimicrobium sp.]|jgi:hypothetical protein|uniref:hypothetical protein n=1 Tax=Longimicrobium sp. TaxID=2029185 RepID=UPI002ED91D45
MSIIEPEHHYHLGSDSDGPIPHLPIRRRRETPEQRAARIKEAVDALRHLAEMGTFDHIEDPGEWQRQIREDRPLPGREW